MKKNVKFSSSIEKKNMKSLILKNKKEPNFKNKQLLNQSADKNRKISGYLLSDTEPTHTNEINPKKDRFANQKVVKGNGKAKEYVNTLNKNNDTNNYKK